MYRFFSLCTLLLLTLNSWSQTPRIIIEADAEVNPWNHLEVNRKEGSFQFAIVTDRTGGLRPGVFPVAVDKLNLLQPEFVMSVGDLITGYTEDEARIDAEWDEFTGFIDKLQMPFFYLPGNHDYINAVMARKWKERFGKDYYHFVYEDVLFLCLNSEAKMRGAGRGSIDEAQLAYVEKVLSEHPEVSWTMVFLHQPLWDQEDPGKWPEVEGLLADRKHTVFAGHRHRYVKYERNNGKYFILATTGGGSGMRGPQFGEFDHVVWITMTKEGPIIANLLLEGIWDEDVNTEARYEMTQSLTRNFPAEVSPLMVEGSSFSEGELAVKWTNNSDVPLDVEMTLLSTQQIWAAADPIKQTIAPNSVEKIRIPLKTAQALPLGDLAPMQLATTATYRPVNQPELMLKRNMLIQPQPWYDLTKSEQTPKIDGKLKDWGSLRYQGFEPQVEADPFSHQGEKDASFSFDVAYDDEFLYLAAEVTDDEVAVSDASAAYQQDGIAFQLNGQTLAASAAYSGFGSPILAISPSESGKGSGNVFRLNRLPEGTKTVCLRTKTGYVVEAALPLSFLRQTQGEDWKHLRLNVVLNDLDQEGAHETKLFWQADWQGEENVLGSGMFQRK